MPRWILCLGLGAATPLTAQTFTGRVLDAATGQPVPAATVSAGPDRSGRPAARTETDASGRFILTLRSPGQYRLRAGRLGYGEASSPPIQLAAGEVFEFDLGLRPASVQLDSIQVATRATPPLRDRRARDFYRRAERGNGHYVTPEMVQQRRPATAMTLLRTMPGILVHGVQQHGLPVMPGRMRKKGPTICVPTLYVNGFRTSLRGRRLDDIVDPDRLWAIEIYNWPEYAPSELPPIDPNCGVIAIWTLDS